MPARSQQLRVAVARAGHAARGGDPVKIESTRRDLAAERIAAYIESVVATAPPLGASQRSRLAALLSPDAPSTTGSPPGTMPAASPRRNHERREADIGEPCPDEAGASPPGARPAARARRNHVNGSTGTSVAADPGAAA